MTKNLKLNHSENQIRPIKSGLGEEETKECFHPNHSHAWSGSWNRPMMIDEDSHHPLTIARMTDHNVRGVNGNKPDERSSLNSSREEMEPKKKAA